MGRPTSKPNPRLASASKWALIKRNYYPPGIASGRGFILNEPARPNANPGTSTLPILITTFEEFLYNSQLTNLRTTASYSLLFEIPSAFRRDHPHIEIKLHTGDPELAITRVLAGEEDIAIGARTEVMPNGLAFRPITTSPLVFIASSNHPQPDSRNWAATPMILSEGGLARSRVDAWFRARGVQPSIYAQVAGNEAIVSMVSLGFGIGVVPRIVLDNSPLVDNIRILDIRPKLKAYEVGLFALNRKLRNPVVKAFWSQLQ